MRILAFPETADRDGNPYVSLLCAGLRAEGVVVDHVSGRRLLSKPDAIHVHWPEQLIRTSSARALTYDATRMLLLIAAARLRGTLLIWTAHNLKPHERRHRRLMDAFLAIFLAQVDLVIGLNAGSRAELVLQHPILKRRPFVVIPHGHYRDAYPDREYDKNESRRRLGLASDRRTLLALGYVRRYKNLPEFVSAFVRAQKAHAQLAVVGRPSSEDLNREIEVARAGDERVHLHLSPATADEVARWHSAADVVVLPYVSSNSMNSGAALLALSLDRPVVMPDCSAARELRERVGGEWVIPVQGGADEFVEVALAAPVPSGPRPSLDQLEWSTLAQQTVAAYRLARTRRLARSRLDRLWPLPSWMRLKRAARH
jgi:glycosyltransferase involved in cell wall biosynthesis